MAMEKFVTTVRHPKSLYLIFVLFLLILGFCSFISCDSFFRLFNKDGRSSKKNLLLITIDSLRLDHLGCYGYKKNTTPNMDAFSKKAVVFENAYTPVSWTHPALASLVTSIHPTHLGIKEVGNILDEKFLTVAELLKEHRYQTSVFITHYLLTAQYGLAQGFDHQEESLIKDKDSHTISTSDQITTLAIDYLRDQAKKPFLCWIHYFDPHYDYLPHKEFYFGEKPEEAYDSEIAFTDHHLGRLFRELENLNLLSNTIVVIVADHGEEFHDHGGTFHGWTVYNEVVRVPLIIYAPGCSPARYTNNISMLDIAPTLLSMIGIEKPNSFEGRTIPYDAGRFAPVSERDILFETYQPGNWNGILRGQWKAVVDLDDRTWQLFDLHSDPSEKVDQKKKKSALFESLRKASNTFFEFNVNAPVKKVLSEEEIERLQSIGYIPAKNSQ